jgi:hypothetical protein
MSLLLTLGFPGSIWTFFIGILLGLGITILTLGFISMFVFIILIYSGVIRITPVLDFIHKCIQTFIPDTELSTKDTIQKLFLIDNTSKITNKGIYCFHPHGSFSVSYFFHTMTSLTEFPVRGRATVAQALYWLPWGQEILETMNAVPNTYGEMKNVLENNNNLFVIPGGVLEMNLERKTKEIKICLKKRRGIFRLAIESGKPLIPVLSYGEEQLYELASFPGFSVLKGFLEKFGVGLPIPSWKTILTWLSVTKGGIKNPIKTFIGDPIEIQKGKVTEEKINQLRNKYIQGIQDLFEKTKLPGYTLEII